jgi:gas vesicle protein
MMALSGLPEPEAAGRRIIATLIGAVLAVIAGLIAAPRRSVA